MDSVSEIKARLPIEQLVGQYVQLKKAGRQFKALCPFHSERTPSFYVSPDRGIAYCFGCHKGGDHFRFIEEIESVDFKGALKILAEKAGVTLPSHTPQSPRLKGQRDRLLALHDEAVRFFADQLLESAEGKKVVEYLLRRGLSEKTIRECTLGFAPDSSHALLSHLLDRDFTKEEILQSGCAFARDTGGGQLMDRFRMRLMFPLENLAGDVCAFGGRAVREGDQPKYLNSPETPLYHKSSLLYNLAAARSDIRRLNSAIVVEGYMDCLAARQAGFTNVVACGGTALTEEQLKTLARFTKNSILSFDRDGAGKLATDRAIEAGLALDFSIKVAVWKTSAKDPDECLREDPAAYKEALLSAQPSLEYIVSQSMSEADLKTLDGKKKSLAYLLPFITSVRSPVERDEWLKKISAACDISSQALYDEVRRIEGRQKVTPRTPLESGEKSSRIFSREEYLLGLLLTYPELKSAANQLITENCFEDNELQNIYRSLTTEYNQSLESSEIERKNVLMMYAESKLGDASWEVIREEAYELVRMIARNRLQRDKQCILRSLRAAPAADRKKLLENYTQLLSQEEHLPLQHSYGKKI